MPNGIQDSHVLSRLRPDHAEVLRDMWQTRREEGFADLVGLAWTLKQRPEHYAAVHAWYTRLRAVQTLDTGPHDTRVWLRLAADTLRFPAAAASIFEQVHGLWVAGLLDNAEPTQRVAALVLQMQPQMQLEIQPQIPPHPAPNIAPSMQPPMLPPMQPPMLPPIHPPR